MMFGEIYELIKDGKSRAARKKWRGLKWIYVQPGRTIHFDELREPIKGWLGDHMITEPHNNLKAENGKIIVGWMPDSSEIYANDWEVLP